MDNYAFSSATETDAHFAVIADRNGALDNSKSYVLTETKFKRLIPFESQSGTRQETYKTGGKLDTWTEAFDSTLVEFELQLFNNLHKMVLPGVRNSKYLLRDT
jgi:hypothetical protein